MAKRTIVGILGIVICISCQDLTELRSVAGRECLTDEVIPALHALNNKYIIGLALEDHIDDVVDLWELENLICRPDDTRLPYVIEIRYTAECRGGGYAIRSDGTVDGRTIQRCEIDISGLHQTIHEVSGGGTVDLGLVVHEVGHCLGLAHPSKVVPSRQPNYSDYFFGNNGNNPHPAWEASAPDKPVMDGFLEGQYKPNDREIAGVRSIWMNQQPSRDDIAYHNDIRDWLTDAVLNSELNDCSGDTDCEFSSRYHEINGIVLHDGLYGSFVYRYGNDNAQWDEIFAGNQTEVEARLRTQGAVHITHPDDAIGSEQGGALTIQSNSCILFETDVLPNVVHGTTYSDAHETNIVAGETFEKVHGGYICNDHDHANDHGHEH